MTETKPTEVPPGVRIFEGKLHRAQRGHGKTFVEGPPQPPPEPVRRPARVAVMLALAHKIEDAIRRGVVRDRAEVARRLGLTRARVTQLMDLTLLAPDLQHVVVTMEAVDGDEPMSERALRSVAQARTWADQRTEWTTIVVHPRASSTRPEPPSIIRSDSVGDVNTTLDISRPPVHNRP